MPDLGEDEPDEVEQQAELMARVHPQHWASVSYALAAINGSTKIELPANAQVASVPASNQGGPPVDEPLFNCHLGITVPRSQAGVLLGRMADVLSQAVTDGMTVTYSSLTITPYEDEDVKEEGSSE